MNWGWLSLGAAHIYTRLTCSPTREATSLWPISTLLTFKRWGREKGRAAPQLSLCSKLLLWGGGVGRLQGWSMWVDTRNCLCWANPAPAASKTWPMLAKHNPISSAGGASVLTYVRKDEKSAAAVRERSEENMREIVLQTQRSWWRRRSSCFRCRAKIALNLLKKSMVKQVVPLEPIKDHTGADIFPAAHETSSDLKVFCKTTISK